jgi:ribosome maturation factor RimP
MADSLEDRVREIAERVARDYGLEVVDCELRGGGKARMLRITIDREAVSSPPSAAGSGRGGTDGAEFPEGSGGVTAVAGVTHAALSGVTHDDCANVSREVSTILDVEDVVPGASYTLEVSSPGLDRKLVRPRDWERFVGSRVRLVTHEAIDGQKAFDGRLQAFRDGRATLELNAGGGKKGKPKQKQQAAPPSRKVEIELANIERAHLVPEF